MRIIDILSTLLDHRTCPEPESAPTIRCVDYIRSLRESSSMVAYDPDRPTSETEGKGTGLHALLGLTG